MPPSSNLRSGKPLKKRASPSRATIRRSTPAAAYFADAEALWGKQCFVVPEYAFAVKVENTSLHLSHEHTEYGWMEYTCAHAMVKYDSNRTALWELNRRTELGLLK